MDLTRYADAWCAVYVRHNHEFAVARLLTEKGYTAFSPSYGAKRRWSDRWKQLQLPLFSGYVFCRLKTDVMAPVLLTPGVIRILSSGRALAAIPDCEIETIQAAVASGYKIQPCDYLEVGSRVRITHGPLSGIEGIVESHRNQNKLVLTVHLVRRSIAVELEACAAQTLASSGKAGPWATNHLSPA